MYEPIQIGTTLWHFDENRRVYPKGDARIGSSPIWREHWVKYTVIGQTSRSWLVGLKHSHFTLPKKAFRGDGCPHGWARSEAGIARHKWVYDNSYRIGQAVSRCNDHDKLQTIERLLQDKTP